MKRIINSISAVLLIFLLFLPTALSAELPGDVDADGEERGYYGAYAFLGSLSQTDKSRLALVFNMDMTAHFKDTGKENYLCVSTEPVTAAYTYRTAYHNIGSRCLTLAHDYLGAGGEAAYYAPVSAGMHDIVPFRKAGIPAVTLSWREQKESANGNDYNLCPPSWIHTSNDRMYNMDTDSLYYTTRLALAAVSCLLADN